MSRLTLVALALLGLVCASMAIDVDFQSGLNVTVNGETVADAELKASGLGFRSLSIHKLTLLGNGIYVGSTGVFVSDSGGSIDIEIDAAYVTNKGAIAVNSRYAASGFVLPSLPIFNWGGNASANIIAQFPYAVIEIDANGADVAAHKLESFAWTASDLLDVVASASGKIAAQAFVGTKNINGNEVEITMSVQTSAVAGVSTVHNENLLPKTWALTIDLSKWVLATAENSLRLQMATATGSAQLSTNGAITVQGPEAKLDAYADLATAASFNGSTISVDISAFFEVDKSNLEALFPTVFGQLEARYNAEVHVYMANCTFGAGSNGFVYSSRTGTGARLSRAANPSSAASTASFSYAVFVAVLALLGFFTL